MRLPAVLVVSLLAVVSLGAAAESEADRWCPTLPADSEMVWTYSRGPDFGVCYTERKEGGAHGLIGVYLGFHPNFTPSEATFLRDGSIDREKVEWHRKRPESSEFIVGVETLHNLNSQLAHVWVLASDQQLLQKLVATSERITFRK